MICYLAAIVVRWSKGQQQQKNKQTFYFQDNLLFLYFWIVSFSHIFAEKKTMKIKWKKKC